MKYNYLLIFSLSIILFSCQTLSTEEGIEGTILCNTNDLNLTETNNIAIASISTPVYWTGSYSESTVTISYTEDLNDNNTTESLNFVFNKIDNCLQIDHGFEFYYGSTADISAITEVDILEAKIQDWEINEKISGEITYRDFHDKLIKTITFWVEFTTDNYIEEKTDFTYFDDCFANKLPIDIDLDNDGTIDYSIQADEVEDFANSPNFTEYTIRLVSKDEEINEILSPKGVSVPFPVIFEPPFSTDNTRSYAANKFNSEDVRNALDVFYEFDTPYESYNFFLQNNLTCYTEFSNDTDDYYAVRLIRNDANYYGWIKIDFNAINCEIEVIDTFLNPIAEEHISVED